MNSHRILISAFVFFLVVSTPAATEVLLVDSIQSAPQIQAPQHGLSMTDVRQQFGDPASTLPAVGEPPISRWEYTDFSVFFENDLALHTVIHRAASH